VPVGGFGVASGAAAGQPSVGSAGTGLAPQQMAGVGSGPPAAGSGAAIGGGAGLSAAGGSGAPAAGSGATVPVGPLPASCMEAANPYTLQTTSLDASFVPASVGNFWGGAGDPALRAMVTVDPSTQRVFVGITRKDSMGFSAVVSAENGAVGDALVVPNAILGGLAATKDGLGVLLYDPNASVDMRMWAAVKRVSAAHMELFSTELFHSANLMDDKTKGNPARGRLGYVTSTDELVAYFGHMQMLQGVRHQGGYIATLSPTGVQKVNGDWFGSHNLDQRLVMVDDAKPAVFGLGDAYPRGYFFSFTARANPFVVYRVAASGDGAANGQVGSMIMLSDTILASFVTDKSIGQDLSAGEWPNIDATISMQIRTAATNGKDVGLLLIPKAGATAEIAPVWVDLQVGAGARLSNLKSVRYGKGDLILMAWSEDTGNAFAPVSKFYTMVVDRTGAPCQPKKALDAMQGFTYDDLLRKPDGTVVWANGVGNVVHVVTLTPH
jgi:hypothetical protein